MSPKGNKDEETVYFGLSGKAWLVIIVVGLFAAGVYTGHIDLSKATEAGSVMSVDMALDSAFVSVVADNNTLADADNNFDKDDGVISIPVDAEVSDDGSTSTFLLKTKDTAGNSVELLNFTNTGVLTTPSDDESIEFVMTITAEDDGSFSSTQDVGHSLITAAASGLADASGDEYYPIVVRTTDTDNPVVYVDGEEDSEKYEWTTSTGTRSIEVSWNVSTGGVIKMDDLSSIPVTVNVEGADEEKFTVNLIRIEAI
ncbi:hypothetical protein [Methanolobus sp. WCC4]|uniref:hypothetical protein n=1 Tax=Methanolobus sp. WCC4 TaxID=3125784 RepID=UPI0030F84EDD